MHARMVFKGNWAFMSQVIKLFVSCHKSGIYIPPNKLLAPIQVGTKLAQSRLPMMMHDDEGNNISEKNRSYCELTGQYWAWKNVDADFFGFFHYRRYFNFSNVEYPIHHEPFIFGDVVFDRNDDETLQKISFSEEVMREVIESYDFISPTPIQTPDGLNAYEQYRLSYGHHIEDLDMVLSIIEKKYPEIWPSAQKYMSQSSLYVCNMFIMKRELFYKYSSFLFDVLKQHEALCDMSHYSPTGRRVSGYLGERLCGIYLTYLYDRGYRGHDLQRVYFRNTDGTSTCSKTQDHCISSSSKKHNVHFGLTTRGTGKIYAEVLYDCDLRSKKVEAFSKIKDGKRVPAKIIWNKTKCILVLAVLSVGQTATVNIFDENNELLGSFSRKFAPIYTKMRSEGNTLTRLKLVKKIRNCDDQPLPDDVRVFVDQIIPENDQVDIIHGSVILPPVESDHKQASDFFEIVALGMKGEQVSTEDWICLDDKRGLSSAYPNYYCRHISYSLKIRHSPSFLIWVRPSSRDFQDGFTCMEWFRVRDMRMTWKVSTTPACDSRDYDDWYIKNHRASQAALELQRNRIFKQTPLFSIVVPLYKTPLSFFKEMVESVEAQTYSHWELVLVNASPDEEGLAEAVRKSCTSDVRIRSISLDRNFGITENTNEGIRISKGDFICFLDHDDILEPDTLYWYASAVNVNSDIDLLYCDEDKLCDGRFINPFFKPDWNPDLLLGMNYVCHFLVVRKSLVDEIELPSSECDGSQDYNMTFQIGEKARSIKHIPRVLYHWRVHEHSTALRATQKNYALETSRHVIQAHLDRCKISGKVIDSPIAKRRFLVDYDLKQEPLVSIIIPNKDSVPILNRCLVSIERHTTYKNYEIVIVENNSNQKITNEYYEEIQREDSHIRVVTLLGMESFNFSKIINYGVNHARGKYILMLNNDTEVITPNWIEQLLGPCMRKDVGVTGAKLLFPDGTTQHAGVTFNHEGPCHLSYLRPRKDGGNFESTLLARDVSAVTGACLLISKQLFDRVGGMDEQLAVNYNDIDLCLKIRSLELQIVFCPTAELFHFESVSRGHDTMGDSALRFRKEKGLFMQRWPQVYEEGDPCGNPNLAQGNIYEILNPNPKKEFVE